MSLYQKYRARNFEEVLTQKHVTDTLQSAIKNNSFGHAYIFVGTRGTGKTSIARIFARTLNCNRVEHVAELGEPCNECESCTLALQGGHIDIIEMDAASNRGIEDVRALKEGVDFLPSIGRFKVYIIDEAHMMTKEAFNALLKTIEEPPKHIVFMMCTTELHKLPATILSRSQVFELKHGSLENIIAKIDHILHNEGKQIEEAGKKLIAKLGKGSFRDTESILEKVINLNNEAEITAQQVVDTLGLSSYTLLHEAKTLFYDKNIKELKDFLNIKLDEGTIANFNYQLAELVYEDISSDLDRDIVDQFKFELFSFLTKVESDLRTSINPKFVYIAQTLNFLARAHVVPSPVDVRQSSGGSTQLGRQDSPPVDVLPPAPPQLTANNPSALLRQRQIRQVPDAQIPVAQQLTSEPPKAKTKFISKLDFLEYIKQNNSFLFRFFSHHDFQIVEDVLVIDAQKQMERDLVSKPLSLEIIKKFGELQGIQLKVEFGDVKVDKRTKEEREVTQIQKTVEDLKDDEIDEIFSV